MDYWVTRVRPGNFEELVKKNGSARWWTKKPPKKWKIGDRVFIWASSPQQEIVAIAELQIPSDKEDKIGYFHYRLRILTDMLSSPIKRSALEGNAILKYSNLLKHGPAYSVLSLSEDEGAELYRLVSVDNPQVLKIWKGFLQAAGSDAEEMAIKGRTDIGSTIKARLIQARRGQGIFRANVSRNENCCRVTGVTDPQHLRASHIKPWNMSNDQEKLTGCNGLLLSPHIDHLFDQGFVSFKNNGDLMVSPKLKRSVLNAWGVLLPKNVGRFNSKQAIFLAFHRSKRFKRKAV